MAISSSDQTNSLSDVLKKDWSLGQSEERLGGAVCVITRPAHSWDDGSQRHSVEFYTLHLHLQQWRPGIWHTTRIPAGARRLHAEKWNFTLKHSRPLYVNVGLGRTEKTRKEFCSCDAAIHNQETFSVWHSADFSSNIFVPVFSLFFF